MSTRSLTIEDYAEAVWDQLKDKDSPAYHAVDPFWKERCRWAAQAVLDMHTNAHPTLLERIIASKNNTVKV